MYEIRYRVSKKIFENLHVCKLLRDTQKIPAFMSNKIEKNEKNQECKRTILDQRRSHLYTQAHTHHKVIEQKEQKWAMYHRRWLWHIN